MKDGLKSIVNLLARIVVLPAFVVYCLSCWLLGTDQAFPGWSQAWSLFPGRSGAYLRRAFYQLVLSQCGHHSWISFGTLMSHATAAIGRQVYIGPYCCLGDVTIEDDVLLGSHVSVSNGGRQHGIDRLDMPIRDQPGCWPRLTIGRDSWIGDRAIIQADVGRHCVIGAGAVVTRPIPDYAVAVGIPARVIRFRNQLEPAAAAIDHSAPCARVL
jgi:acetyltransferase-like isoleucine patch superfamily enzyme